MRPRPDPGRSDQGHATSGRCVHALSAEPPDWERWRVPVPSSGDRDRPSAVGAEQSHAPWCSGSVNPPTRTGSPGWAQPPCCPLPGRQPEVQGCPSRPPSSLWGPPGLRSQLIQPQPGTSAVVTGHTRPKGLCQQPCCSQDGTAPLAPGWAPCLAVPRGGAAAPAGGPASSPRHAAPPPAERPAATGGCRRGLVPHPPWALSCLSLQVGGRVPRALAEVGMCWTPGTQVTDRHPGVSG